MIPLFIYTVTVFGLAFIVGQSQISLPFRQWLSDTAFGKSTHGKWFLELVECPACLSTWLGGVFAWALPIDAASIFHLPFTIRIGIGIAIVAAYSCGASAIIGLLTKLMSVPMVGMEDSDPSLLAPEEIFDGYVQTATRLHPPYINRPTVYVDRMTEDERHVYWKKNWSDKMTYEEFCNPMFRPTQKRE